MDFPLGCRVHVFRHQRRWWNSQPPSSSFSTDRDNEISCKLKEKRTAPSMCWWRWVQWRGKKTSNIFRRTCALSPLQKWLFYVWLSSTQLTSASSSPSWLMNPTTTICRISPLRLPLPRCTRRMHFSRGKWGKFWEEFFTHTTWAW